MTLAWTLGTAGTLPAEFGYSHWSGLHYSRGRQRQTKESGVVRCHTGVCWVFIMVSKPHLKSISQIIWSGVVILRRSQCQVCPLKVQDSNHLSETPETTEINFPLSVSVLYNDKIKQIEAYKKCTGITFQGEESWIRRILNIFLY